jgi:hypothetical protein
MLIELFFYKNKHLIYYTVVIGDLVVTKHSPHYQEK